MPTHKDFKRLVRGRMRKTGESYTTARGSLLSKPVPRAAPIPDGPAPADYARLAGTSNATLKAKTGCDWQRWVAALDYKKASTWSHREIAEYVHNTYKIPGWWAQTVTVGYERIRGLRDIGQRRGGSYEANKSKTIAAPVAAVFRAFTDARRRRLWLPGVKLTVRKAAPDKSVRIAWADGTRVEVWLMPKGDGKAVASIQHGPLPDREAVDRVKAFWSERLEALASLLAPRH